MKKPVPFDQSLIHFSSSTFSKSLVDWYQVNQRRLPWRVLWCEYKDPYHIWTSEIMLQQTVIKAMIPVYQRFLARFPDVKSLALASEETIKKTVQGLGYYRRFRYLHMAAQQLHESRKQENKIDWPRTFEGWKKLPGIGDYTAAAVSSIAFNQAAAVVDGNVERVFCRVFDIRQAPNLPHLKKLFTKISQSLICHSRPGDYNQALMELGQTICLPATPNCDTCPIKSVCLSRKCQSTHLAPQPKIKKDKIAIELRLNIIQRGQKFAIFERCSKAKFLKETPGFITEIKKENSYAIDGSNIANLSQSRLIGSFNHSITNHKLSVKVFLAKLNVGQTGLKKKWYTFKELDTHLISNLDRKAWKLFQKNQIN